MTFLAHNEVHLWRVAIAEADTPSVTGALSESERLRAIRYRFERDRREFIVTRGTLRCLLADYSGQPAETLSFTHNRNGKPSLDGGLQFSVSHSGGFALIAVSHMCVGVDLERVNGEFAWQSIARQFFTQRERDWISSQPPDALCESFFRCWTRREAYVKARGTGITEAECSISAASHAADQVWAFESFKPFSGYIAALAVQAEIFRCTLRDFATPPVRSIPSLVVADAWP